ncbi:MAG: hypothetical protein U0610_11350 [bacterium]
MSKLGWLTLLLAAAIAVIAVQSRHRAPRVATPPSTVTPTDSAAAPRASSPSPAPAAERRGSSAGGAPLTEPGTTAGIEGILAGSKTTPHLEDATQKARNAMRSYGAAEGRDRAALGASGNGRGQGSEEP